MGGLVLAEWNCNRPVPGAYRACNYLPRSGRKARYTMQGLTKQAHQQASGCGRFLMWTPQRDKQ